MIIGRQERRILWALFPHSAVNPCVRFSGTRLTDDFLDMVTQASGNGRFQSVQTNPGRGTRVWATVRLTSAKVSASLLKQPAFEPRSHIMAELAQLGGGVADAEVAPIPAATGPRWRRSR